ncbi:MBL fold metallo-hydrolase [Bacillus nakamurai]|uniref:MBL fold metallo-hydrolase n=2 Tax=Bacillus nakamurai TaxID=1793963 RepID=A0A150F748_9BACI|nr:MBL fold metallo-hydrolase [Bacillus nakamurai]KXZ17262.1 MBL fold metallo-hydrolase [Bacillus nakamurai]KXZ17358.1 MBL fold metallo-hydrolase [Bacillus nakamurai]
MNRPYEIQFGSNRMIVLSDGTFPVTKEFFLAGAHNDQEVDRFPDEFEVALNFVCLQIGGKHILIDTGFGETGGQESGQLLTHLHQSGIHRNLIDYVVLSHSHLDHTGGLVKNGKPAFPNAIHIMSKKEWLYAEQTPESKQFKVLNKVLPLLKVIEEDTEILPGVLLKHTPGHTPGHLTAEVLTNNGVYLFANDVFNIPYSISNTNLRVVLEEDSVQGVKTRNQLIQSARKERAFLHSCHFPYPGLGTIEKINSLYKWKPIERKHYS